MGLPKSLLGKTGEIRFNIADTFKGKRIHDYNTLKKYKRTHSFFFFFFSTLAGAFIIQEELMSSDTIPQDKDKADCYTTTPTQQQLQYFILLRQDCCFIEMEELTLTNAVAGGCQPVSPNSF